jgi:two-component system chemotaxis response regulator CheY
MRCLVVDESATMRRILGNAAREAGCDEVIEAADGGEALDRWETDIRIVVTGWLTPAMSGPEMVRRLRAKPGSEGLRVMVVTSRNGAAQVDEAKQAGVEAYLVKPVATADLVARLRELCAAAGGTKSGLAAGGHTAAGPTGQANADSLDRAA